MYHKENRSAHKRIILGIVICAVLFANADQPEYMQGWDTTEPTADTAAPKNGSVRSTSTDNVYAQPIVQDFQESSGDTALIEDFSVVLGLESTPNTVRRSVVWKEIDLSKIGLDYSVLSAKNLVIYEISGQQPASKKAVTGPLPWQYIPLEQNSSKGFLLWLAPPIETSSPTRYFCFEKPGAKLPAANLDWKTDLKVRKSKDALTVSNRYYELGFDLQQNGVLTFIKFPSDSEKIAVQCDDKLEDYKKRMPDLARPIFLRKGVISSEGQELGFLLDVSARMAADKYSDVRFGYKYLFTADCPLISVRTEIPEQRTQTFVNTIELQAYRVSSDVFKIGVHPYTDAMLTYLSDAFSLLVKEDNCFGMFSPRLSRPSVEGNAIRVVGSTLKGRSDGRAQPWSGEKVQIESLLYFGPHHQALSWLQKAPGKEARFVDVLFRDKPEIAGIQKKMESLRTSDNPQEKTILCMAEMLLQYAHADWQSTGDWKRYASVLKTASDFLSTSFSNELPIVFQTSHFMGLANPKAGFLFDVSDNQVSLSAVWNPALQKFVVLNVGTERVGVWRLRMSDYSKKQRTNFEWDGSDATLKLLPLERLGSQQVKISFNWQPNKNTSKLPSVQASFMLDNESPLLTSWVQTGRCGDNVVFWEVDFPVVSGIGYPFASSWQSHLATPFHSGLRIDGPGTRLFDRDGMLYPGAAGWQFLSYYDDSDSAFYFAAHDDQGYMKRFRHDPNGASLTLRYTHQPEGKGTAATAFKSSYPCLFGPYQGDWYEATQMYRQFMLNTQWFPKKTLAENDRLPQWFKEYPVSIRIFTGNKGQKLTEFAKKNLDLIEALKLPATLVQWYGWNDTKPHMVGRPEQYPDPEFLKAIPQFKERNAHIMPYSCALLWDVRNEAYKTLGGEKSAMRDLNGEVVMARYGGQPLAMVSPSHPIYQDYMASTFQTILDSLDVDALYFDMWGTSSGGHYRAAGEPWGGNGRTLGMRELGKKVKSIGLSKNPQFVMAMEGNADCYLDIVDCYIMFTANLPIRLALYGDYVRPFGDKSSQWREDAVELFEPASQFAWGMPIGRLFEFNMYREGKLDPDLLAYFRKLASYRLVAVPWLNYGKMLRPLRLYEAAQQDRRLQSELLPHGVWRAPDGTVAFVFANSRYSVQETVFKYQMVLSDYGIPSDGSWTLSRLTPKESGNGYKPHFEPIGKLTGTTVSRTERIPGADVLILVAQLEKTN